MRPIPHPGLFIGILAWIALPVGFRAGDAAAFGPIPAAGENSADEGGAVSANEDHSASSEGLWPTPKLTRMMLARWAEGLSDEYDLSEEQRKQVREMVVDRWAGFLEANRETLQPLANEFLEMRMGLEPPPADRVQAWAERAEPMYLKFKEQLGNSNDDFREVLTPLQRVRFEADVLRFQVGLKFVDKQMADFKSGAFEPEDLWMPIGDRGRERRSERRRERREQMRQAMAEAEQAAEPVDQIALELNRWEQYVADFITRFGLDEGQRTAARSILTEVKQRASDHRERRRDEIVELEKRIETNQGTEEELAAIKQRLVELYGPIDDLFVELQRRLEAVPTAEQRARAAESESVAESKSAAAE